ERFPRRALLGARRHPVDRIAGEELEPFAEAPLVEQPRLLEQELLDLVFHGQARWRCQVSSWLRIATSLLPGLRREPSAWRWSASTPRRAAFQSLRPLSSPAWQRSKISRSSEATSDAGDAARVAKRSVSSCISGGAPSSRKQWTSTTVRLAASGFTMRSAAK